MNETDSALVEKLRLTHDGHLKRAGVLLFHPDPEAFITGSYIKIGFFETDSEILYQHEVHGDVFSQVDKVIEILHAKYLKAMISYQGIQRIETYPVPETALREAILNAVAHKDYASSIPIQIRVHNNRLMIFNMGSLPAELTMRRLLKEHSSQPLNPDISHVFYKAGMVESWGRGIEKILDACKEAKIPVPEIILEPTSFWIKFHFAPAGRKTVGDRIGDVTGDVTGDGLTSSQDSILNLLHREPSLTISQISQRLKLEKRWIERNISKLKKIGALKRIGGAKGGRWKILKHNTADKG